MRARFMGKRLVWQRALIADSASVIGQESGRSLSEGGFRTATLSERRTAAVGRMISFAGPHSFMLDCIQYE